MDLDRKKFYAVVRVDNLDLPEVVTKSSFHSHISSAVDEAIENLKQYLKNNGINGKFDTHIEVFAKEESVCRLIEIIKAKVKA
ncbi:MAG: hypothetical protein MPF33_03605 [Candidatus Aramenus sp.]|jgi:formamidopyrimidine-DNA glycosylase|nr:hypothetical protein [Candidatus Aramenus sp.]